MRGEKTVASDYAVVTGFGLISALVSLASAMLITRLLLPSAFGVLSLVLVTSTVIQTVTTSWTIQAVARFGRERLELAGSMAAVTRARFTITLPVLALSSLGVLALKAVGVLPAALTWPLVGLAIVHGIVVIGYEHAVNLLRSLGRQRMSGMAVLLQQVVLVAVTGTLLATHTHTTPMAIGVLYTAGNAILGLAYVPLLRGVGFARVPRDRELERRIWRFSAPLIAYTASSYVIGSVDVWILGAFRPVSTVGHYAAAYRGYTVLMAAVSAASPVFTTLFVSMRLAGREADVQAFVRRVCPALMLGFGALVALAVGPAYALTPIVFGSSFAAAGLPLAILIFGLVAYMQCCLLGTVLTAHDATRDSARANVIGAVINIVGDVIAVGLLGAGTWAPALATVVCSLCVAAGFTLSAARVTAVPARFPVDAYIPGVLAVLALILVPAGVRVPASVGVGLVTAALVLALRGPGVGIDRELLGTVLGATPWRRGDTAGRSSEAGSGPMSP